MQLLADFFPLLLFFVAFKWQGIYFATGGRDRGLGRRRSPGLTGSAAACRAVQLAVARDHRRVRRRDARCCRTRRSSSGSRRCSTGCSARSSPCGKLALRPQPARAPDEGHRAARRRLVAPHLVVGRVLRVHGRRQLVRRVPLSRPRRGSTSRSGAASACSSSFALAQGLLLAAPRRRRRRRDELAATVADVPAVLRARLAPLAPGALEITDDSAAHAGHAGAAGGGRALFAADRVRGLFRALPARAPPAGAARASPTCCRIRSTRFRSGR